MGAWVNCLTCAHPMLRSEDGLSVEGWGGPYCPRCAERKEQADAHLKAAVEFHKKLGESVPVSTLLLRDAESAEARGDEAMGRLLRKQAFGIEAKESTAREVQLRNDLASQSRAPLLLVETRKDLVVLEHGQAQLAAALEAANQRAQELEVESQMLRKRLAESRGRNDALNLQINDLLPRAQDEVGAGICGPVGPYVHQREGLIEVGVAEQHEDADGL